MPPGVLEGTVREVLSDGQLMVTLDRQSKSILRGPCPWAGGPEITPASPTEGDYVWVVEADTRRFVVVCWWKERL